MGFEVEESLGQQLELAEAEVTKLRQEIIRLETEVGKLCVANQSLRSELALHKQGVPHDPEAGVTGATRREISLRGPKLRAGN